MRHLPSRSRTLGYFCGLLVVVFVVGCVAPVPIEKTPPASSQTVLAPSVAADQDINVTAEAYARRVEEVMAESGHATVGVPTIIFEERAPKPASADPEPAQKVRDPRMYDGRHLMNQDPTRAVPSPGPIIAPSQSPSSPPTAAADTRRNEPDLKIAQSGVHLNEWVEAVRRSSQPAMPRALTTATLLATDSKLPLAPDDLSALTDEKREQVERYHAFVSLLRRTLAAGDDLDKASMIEQLEGMFARQPIKIVCVHLCRRVRGFGDFDTFEEQPFLAGRVIRLVLYVEVDQYHVVESDGMHEVRLSQEVIVYTDPGGTPIWKQPPVQIVDTSRNRRRDFFVTQLIHLPQTLSVGKYLLKVAVSDGNGGTLDETGVPFDVVADRRMVQAEGR